MVIFNGGFVPLKLSTRGTISAVDIIPSVHLIAGALRSGRKEIVRHRTKGALSFGYLTASQLDSPRKS